MRKAFILPAAALAGGAAGFFLRRWELSSAFETETGLPIPGAPAFWALVLWSAAVIAALLLLSRGRHHSFPRGYDQAFDAKGNTAYVTAMVLAAFLLLAAGGSMLMGLPAVYDEALAAAGMAANPRISALFSLFPKVLIALLSVGSFAALLALGRGGYRGEGKGKRSIALLVPGYLAAIWLITAYQAHAGDPIRQGYVYKIVAILCTLLAAYFMAGYSFEKGRFTRTVGAALAAVYFSMVTLADGHDLTAMLLFGGFILYLMAGVTTLICNDALRLTQGEDLSPRETETTTEEITDEG